MRRLDRLMNRVHCRVFGHHWALVCDRAFDRTRIACIHCGRRD